MNDIIKTLEQNKKAVNIALAALMLLIFAFCPVCDIIGKAKINGLKLVFDGDGLGFSRFIAFLTLMLPAAGIALQFVSLTTDKLLKGNQALYCACLALILILAAALPEGISLAWGAYVFILISVAGITVSFLPRLVKKD